MTNNKLLLLFVAFAFFMSQSEAKCGKEVKDFMACWHSATTKHALYKRPEVLFTDFQSDISKCFTKNGCASIVLEAQDTPGDAVNCLAPDPSQDIDLTGATDKTKDCISKLKQNIRDKSQKCAQTKLDKDFQFPEPHKHSKEKLLELAFLDEYAHEIFQKWSNESICKTSTNNTAVAECVNTIFDKVDDFQRCESPFMNAVAKKNYLRKLCDASCFKKLTPSCQALNETYPIISACSFEESDPPNLDGNVQDLKKCLGSDSKATDDNLKDIVAKVAAGLVHRYTSSLPEDPCHPSANDG